jgi:HlyD family secretion protein
MAREVGGTSRLFLKTLFEDGIPAGLTDGQLLERFATSRGEPAELAFAILVERHGPMVLRACRGILRDDHEAIRPRSPAFRDDRIPAQGRDLHHSRVARQKATRDAMSSRIAAARRVRAHEETLAKTAVITESDRFVSDDKIREMEALERAEEERLAELEALDPEAEIRRTEYSLKAAEARRDQAQQALDECRLKAPRPGTVLRILVGPGDILAGQPGQPAMLFAADGPQVVRATVEQEFAGRIKEGMPALVYDEADPSATWRGRVVRIAGWYSQRRTVLHDPSQLSDVRTLECVIVLEAGQPRLRIGQSVRIFLGAVPR